MAKLSAFGQAFKEARERGDATFEFNGKKYTTEMAGEKKAATPAAKPAPAPRNIAPPPAEEEAATRTPARTTVMPSGSLMGTIARSQGAESTFPEPTSDTSFNTERAMRQRAETMGGMSNALRKLKRVLGTQAMRDEEAATENYAKGGKVRGWGKARSARKAKMY